MKAREQLTDQLLVLHCQEGNPMALEQLMERWQDRLWRHANRLCNDDQAAWDALQEAWIAIARGIHRLRQPEAFPSWAYRITSNKCRSWIRGEVRRQAMLESYAEEQADPPDGEDPTGASLAVALRQLEGPDQAILTLYYYERFSVPEVAEILRIPPGTVKSRLYHARQKLRRKMEDPAHE